MSHIRDGGNGGGGQGGVGGDPQSPMDCPEVLLLDQCLPPDTQCQFILKPNKVVPGMAQLFGKTVKRNAFFFIKCVMRFLTVKETLGFH